MYLRQIYFQVLHFANPGIVSNILGAFLLIIWNEKKNRVKKDITGDQKLSKGS